MAWLLPTSEAPGRVNGRHQQAPEGSPRLDCIVAPVDMLKQRSEWRVQVGTRVWISWRHGPSAVFATFQRSRSEKAKEVFQLGVWGQGIHCPERTAARSLACASDLPDVNWEAGGRWRRFGRLKQSMRAGPQDGEGRRSVVPFTLWTP